MKEGNYESLPILKRISQKCENSFILDRLRKAAIQGKQSAARAIYNLESRNIKKFTKQWLELQAKLKDQNNKLSTWSPQKQTTAKPKKVYDQNELLEMNYSRIFTHRRTKTQCIDDNSTQRNKNMADSSRYGKSNNFKRSTKVSFSLKKQTSSKPDRFIESPIERIRKRSRTFVNQSDQTIQRKRVITQWYQKGSQQSQLSLRKVQKTATKADTMVQEQIFTMTKDKMNRFVKNMHKLAIGGEFLLKNKNLNIYQIEYKQVLRRAKIDLDNPILQANLNFNLICRYGLNSNYLEDEYEQKTKILIKNSISPIKNQLLPQSQYSLLSSLSQNSVLDIMVQLPPAAIPKKKAFFNERKLQQLHVQKQKDINLLPFSQFISFRQTKATVYRLVSMSHKRYLSIAFNIFDKNQNGYIDEDDLIQAIQLSRRLPQLLPDILFLSRTFVRLPATSSPNKRVKTNKQESQRSYNNGNSVMNPISEENNQMQEAEEENQNISSSRFSLANFFTFLKNKRQKKQNKINPFPEYQSLRLNNISFTVFCQIFKQRLPVVIYDFFSYLFGANPKDFNHIPAQWNMIKQEISQINVDYDETLEQRWNKRLINTNGLIKQLWEKGRSCFCW